jgi:hypothetical protein
MIWGCHPTEKIFLFWNLGWVSKPERFQMPYLLAARFGLNVFLL